MRRWSRSIISRGLEDELVALICVGRIDNPSYREGSAVCRLHVLEITLALTVAAGAARADSIWSRADPSTAFMFQSYKAHRVGDLLTIVVDENTGFEGMEQRQLS